MEQYNSWRELYAVTAKERDELRQILDYTRKKLEAAERELEEIKAHPSAPWEIAEAMRVRMEAKDG